MQRVFRLVKESASWLASEYPTEILLKHSKISSPFLLSVAMLRLLLILLPRTVRLLRKAANSKKILLLIYLSLLLQTLAFTYSQ